MAIEKRIKKLDPKTGATGGSRKLPSIYETAKAGIDEDSKRLEKTLKKSPHPSTKAAGKRAASRLLGRAGLLGAAAEVGKAVGEKIESKTGIGKKIGSITGDIAAKKISKESRKKVSRMGTSRHKKIPK